MRRLSSRRAGCSCRNNGARVAGCRGCCLRRFRAAAHRGWHCITVLLGSRGIDSHRHCLRRPLGQGHHWTAQSSPCWQGLGAVQERPCWGRPRIIQAPGHEGAAWGHPWEAAVAPQLTEDWHPVQMLTLLLQRCWRLCPSTCLMPACIWLLLWQARSSVDRSAVLSWGLGLSNSTAAVLQPCPLGLLLVAGGGAAALTLCRHKTPGADGWQQH